MIEGDIAARAEQFRARGSPPCARRSAAYLVGQTEVVEGVLTCLFVGGHALLEGVPGLGKDAVSSHAGPGTRP